MAKHVLILPLSLVSMAILPILAKKYTPDSTSTTTVDISKVDMQQTSVYDGKQVNITTGMSNDTYKDDDRRIGTVVDEARNIRTPLDEKATTIRMPLEDAKSLTTLLDEKATTIRTPIEDAKSLTTLLDEKATTIRTLLEDAKSVTTPSDDKATAIRTPLEDAKSVTTLLDEKGTTIRTPLEDAKSITTPEDDASLNGALADRARLDNMIDTQIEIVVDPSSSYCKPEFAKTVCNYSGTDQIVMFPAELTLPIPQFFLRIESAKTVHLYPVCIHLIDIVNVSHLYTSPANEGSRNRNRKECNIWLRLYDSHAEFLSHADVNHLSINGSSVNKISLRSRTTFTILNSLINSIENVRLQDSEKSSIFNSTINRFQEVIADGALTIINSKVNFVSDDGLSFDGSRMDVINSEFSRISHQGIRIMNGIAMFSNVEIGFLGSYAISTKFPEAHLHLSNVTIKAAVPNSIVCLDRNRITISNVTIKGVSVDTSSPYFRFEDDSVLPEGETEVTADGNLPQCTKKESSLKCNFTGIDEVVDIEAKHIENLNFVQISNARSLRVMSTECNMTLRLDYVNGSLPHFTTESVPYTEMVTNKSVNENLNSLMNCGMTLLAVHSHLEVVSARYISTMELVNCTLERLHEGTIDIFNGQSIKIQTLDSFKIKGRGSKWIGITVQNIFNVTFQSTMNISQLNVIETLKPEALIIDHENETTEISNSTISHLGAKSLWVLNGTLVLKNVHVKEYPDPGAIYLEDGASLEFYNVTCGSFDYTPFSKIISVASKSQVTFEDSFDINRRYKIIHLRIRPAAPSDGTSNLTVVDILSSPYCHYGSDQFVCQFSSVPNASVVADLEHRSARNENVEFRDAAFVQLHPSCSNMIFLRNVTKATTIEDEEDGCSTILDAENVKFLNITSCVHGLSLTSCTVDVFSPNQMLSNINLAQTQVKDSVGVHWYEREAYFNDCQFQQVNGMIASSPTSMINSNITKIETYGLIIHDKMIVEMSHINEIATKGILVKGTLNLINVSIGHLRKKAIVVEIDGVLNLFNVNINSSDVMSIVASEYGAVSMKRVIVSGKRVHWRGYTTDNSGRKLSVVFLNKDFEGGNGLIPPVSSTEENWLVTKGPMGRQSKASWKMATVVLIILLIVVLCWCLYYTVKLIKLEKRTVMPQVSWQAREDQTHLLEDQDA